MRINYNSTNAVLGLTPLAVSNNRDAIYNLSLMGGFMKKMSLRVVAKQSFFLILLTHLLTYSLTHFLYADSFKILGTRPLALGGAFVAFGEDALAQYWNPAGLGIGKDVDVQIPVGVQLEATGDILGSANRLADIADQFTQISNAQKTGKAISLDQLSAFVKGIKELDSFNDPKKGILVDISAGANIRVSHFAVSVNNFTSFGTDPSVDIKNLGLGSGTFSPHLKKVVYRAESFNGVNLGSLISVSGVAYTDPTDSNLKSSASMLSATVDVLISAAEVQTGGYSSQQIANAIINAATDPTIAAQLGWTALTSQQVSDYVNQIEELRPLLIDILVGITGTSYAKNQSNLTVRGASVLEASLGYGRKAPYIQSIPVFGSVFKGLYIGGNLKYMMGYVGYAKSQVLSDTDVDPFSDLSDNKKTSNAVGLDLGLLLKKERLLIFKKAQFGLLLRNINSPKFDQPTEAVADGENSKYKIDPQIRGGVALWPFNWWTISTDLDLTKNSTPLPKYNSRLWGLGNEFNLVNSAWFNLALRVGLMKNLAESTTKVAYTGGFGLTLAHFVIDLGGAMSTDTVEITDGTKVPSSGAAAVTISFDF